MPNNMIIIIMLILMFLFVIFEIVCMWKVYKKAGVPGWASIVPIYNIIVLFKLANIPMWMFILLFIPLLNFYPMYLVYTALADRLGKSRIYGILLLIIPVIIYPILAFSKSKLESTYMNLEEEVQMDSKPLMDGPIEPLDAMPDIEENQVEEIIEVEEVPSSFNEMTPEIVTSNIVAPQMEEPYLEPIEAMIPIHVEDPLTAQQKVQHVEEEKEVYPDVNIFKTCPNCGTKVEPNAAACFLCGKRFEE